MRAIQDWKARSKPKRTFRVDENRYALTLPTNDCRGHGCRWDKVTEYLLPNDALTIPDCEMSSHDLTLYF